MSSNQRARGLRDRACGCYRAGFWITRARLWWASLSVVDCKTALVAGITLGKTRARFYCRVTLVVNYRSGKTASTHAYRVPGWVVAELPAPSLWMPKSTQPVRRVSHQSLLVRNKQLIYDPRRLCRAWLSCSAAPPPGQESSPPISSTD